MRWATKGLCHTGPGAGNWYLELTSDLDIMVLSYIRHPDGFLTSMHDLAPRVGTRYVVAIFASNLNQQSSLRLVNPGTEAADVRIRGVDRGVRPGRRCE